MDQPRREPAENRYYAPGRERADKVRLLFARIAGRYDRINDLMSLGLHRRWKRELVRRAAPAPGSEVLDLCCGSGDVARMVAAAGSARVTGLDFTEEMLAVARQATPPGMAVTYRQGDALQLPFPDGSFDVVTVAYGLRNLADLDRGLEEIHRVLRPGGRLASLEFGRPPNRLIRAAYFAYLRLALPLLGLAFFGDPHTYGYIYTTVSRFPGQHDLAGRMRAAGFHPVEVHDRIGGTMGICVAARAGPLGPAP